MLFLAAVLALPPEVWADRLLWLAPAPLPPGPLRVGLVALDGNDQARRPEEAVARAGKHALLETVSEGPVRVFSIDVTDEEAVLHASAPGMRDAVWRVSVGPPRMTVEVRATPSRPVKGRDADVALEIAVSGGDLPREAMTSLPIVWASAGRVTDLVAAGDGRYTARYVLPERRFPEAATVLALFPWPHENAVVGAMGRLSLPLASAVALPGKSEPNAEISVEIARERFGPVRADGSGHFDIPVVVPPGERFATSTALDQVGNRRKRTIDLKLPPTDPLACFVHPTTLPADGESKGRIVCAVTDAHGSGIDGAAFVSQAGRGRLSGPHAMGGGLYEWVYAAPAEIGEGKDTLGFELQGTRARETVEIALVPLAASRVSLIVESQPVFAGASGRVTLEARDALGRLVEARPAISARHGTLGPFAAGPHGLDAAYRAPSEVPADWTDVLEGVVSPAPGDTVARVAARVSDSRVVAQALGARGEPVSGALLRSGGDDVRTDADGVATFALPAGIGAGRAVTVEVVGSPGLAAQVFRVPTAQGDRYFPQGRESTLEISARVSLAPPTPVDVRIESLERRALRYRIVDLAGRPMSGREASVAVARGDGTAVSLGPEQPGDDGTVVVPLLDAAEGPLSASVTDVATGVSAATESGSP